MRPLQLKWLWLSIAVALTIVMIVGSLAPAPTGVEFKISDKLIHFLAYGILAGWYGAVFVRARYGWIFVGLFLLGLSLEYGQMLTGRDFDLYDQLANTLGIIVALLLCRAGCRYVLVRFERHVLRLNLAAHKTHT